MTVLSVEAKKIITTFELEPHIEGGWFRRTFQSDLLIDQNYSINCNNNSKHVTTSIFYLLTRGEFSVFHKLKSYETWHFYRGDSVIIYWFDKDGNINSQILGTNYEKGELPQLTIKPNTYFAAELLSDSDFAFVGCSVSPGFDFNDFTLANRTELIKNYPKHLEVIKRLTKE